jgi:hypothetical protein
MRQRPPAGLELVLKAKRDFEAQAGPAILAAIPSPILRIPQPGAEVSLTTLPLG